MFRNTVVSKFRKSYHRLFKGGQLHASSLKVIIGIAVAIVVY